MIDVIQSLNIERVCVCWFSALCLVPSIVAYLKEVESPYEVHDFIRSYLGDTVEAKEFAKQFLERRAKQKANQQRQQQQVTILIYQSQPPFNTLTCVSLLK